MNFVWKFFVTLWLCNISLENIGPLQSSAFTLFQILSWWTRSPLPIFTFVSFSLIFLFCIKGCIRIWFPSTLPYTFFSYYYSFYLSFYYYLFQSKHLHSSTELYLLINLKFIFSNKNSQYSNSSSYKINWENN